MTMPGVFSLNQQISTKNGLILPSQPNKGRSHQTGFTLIEILVAMTLGLLLLAGVLQIFINSKASYRFNEAQSRLQENGRFALQMVAEDIRIAGFWGCQGSGVLVVDHLNPPGGSFVNPALSGIIGTEVAGTPDSITLQGAVGGGLPVNSHTVATATITTSANNGLAQGDLFLVGDCTRADLLQITNPNPGAGTVNFVTGGSNITGPTVAYGVNAVLYRAGSVAYTIANGNSGQPSLFRSVNGAAPTELVEGVEDLQIVYGADTNGDGTANIYDTANIVNMNTVVSVRVDLVLRSLDDNIASTVDANAGDRRLRRTFSSTIVLRNRVP